MTCRTILKPRTSTVQHCIIAKSFIIFEVTDIILKDYRETLLFYKSLFGFIYWQKVLKWSLKIGHVGSKIDWCFREDVLIQIRCHICFIYATTGHARNKRDSLSDSGGSDIIDLEEGLLLETPLTKKQNCSSRYNNNISNTNVFTVETDVWLL